MPVHKVCCAGRKSPAKSSQSLAQEVSEATSDLLTQSDRVLVVYEKETANLYYEADARPPTAAPRSLSRAG